MNAVVTSLGRVSGRSIEASKGASDEIKSRHSQELVIALSGPVGCGIEHVRNVLTTTLGQHGYEVVLVRISQHFESLAQDLGVENPTLTYDGNFDRISKFQDLGNSLRTIVGDDLGAQIALTQISLDRANRHPGVPVRDIKPARVAYLIDQLKNPTEASLLRGIYGNLFYLVGVLSSYESRKGNLIASGMQASDAETLIERDRAESGGGGQQLEKTLKSADYFVRNIHNNIDELGKPLERFVGLVHGKNGITPTQVERGMYAAYSAAMRSACLSRQVGAAIMDRRGNIIATGCNDVPRSGGGLYEAGQPPDHRCIFKEGGVCFNDKYKGKLRNEIAALLRKGGIDTNLSDKLADSIRSSTRLRDLIEFSRAVHAEMDALITAARNGGNGVQDCILFTTTYPCHNCARHIVAAGIRAVYFIEPYGKSLANELHSDAIDHNADAPPDSISGLDKRVAFLHFEGVSPNRFANLFSVADSRKDASGRATQYLANSAEQKVPELLDNYRELEAKVAERLRKRKASLSAANDPGGGAA